MRTCVHVCVCDVVIYIIYVYILHNMKVSPLWCLCVSGKLRMLVASTDFIVSQEGDRDTWKTYPDLVNTFRRYVLSSVSDLES